MDLSKTFNIVGIGIKQLDEIQMNPVTVHNTPGTVKLAARQLGGPGSSFRNLELNGRQNAVGLLHCIGGVRKGAGGTLAGSDLEKHLKEHKDQ